MCQLRKGCLRKIGATTLVGKGREKKVKKKTGKKFEAEDGVMGIKASQGTKQRKTASTCKQLTNYEDPGDVDPSAA